MSDVPHNVSNDQASEVDPILERLRTLLGRQSKPSETTRLVHVIVNPAAGRGLPVLKILNTTFQEAGVDWELFVTKEAGDGQRLAQEAVQAGASIVVAHGGDGTVTEVARGLMNSSVPMAILPGGTANIMSLELGIPADLAAACALVVNPEAGRVKVDMGRIDEHYFLLRSGMGLEAAMVEGADRDMKDRYGILAYALAGLQALSDPPIARYRLEMDGMVIETSGLTCIVANSGQIGIPGRKMAPNVSISDGLLDVIILRKVDLSSILAVAATVLSGTENPEALLHWQARQIRIDAQPVQTVQIDGEVVGETPITAEVIPGAVEVVIPPEQS